MRTYGMVHKDHRHRHSYHIICKRVCRAYGTYDIRSKYNSCSSIRKTSELIFIKYWLKSHGNRTLCYHLDVNVLFYNEVRQTQDVTSQLILRVPFAKANRESKTKYGGCLYSPSFTFPGKLLGAGDGKPEPLRG